MKMRKIVSQIGTIFLTAIEACGIYYIFLPALSIQSTGLWGYIIAILILAIINGLIGQAIIMKKDADNYDNDVNLIKENLITVIVSVIAVLVILTLIITSIASSKMFNASKYANLISVSEDRTFEQDFKSITDDMSKLVAVDQKTAQKLGDRTIGTVKNASWYNVNSEYNLCSINGEYYRISPIDYSNIFSQKKVVANGGIPGYVVVNAMNQEAKYISLDNGMKYSPSGYFKYDLKRCIRKDFKKEILGSSFFEVDDSNTPYWITGVLEATIGIRGGLIQKGIIITNATTGESRYFEINDIPTWVDHACSLEYLMTRIQWFYYLSNGFWNFSKTNCYKTTFSYRESTDLNEENESTPFDGYNSIISQNGEILFLTGITPVSNAETNIGFVTVSARTGKVQYYAVEGAEESSAQAAVEGLVQNQRYSATFPVLINVSGEETYFMALKDDAGLIQRYALCNIKNYTMCVEDETIDEAISKYLKTLGKTSEKENIQAKNINGIISSVKEAEIEGYTFYYFTLQNDDIISNLTLF